MGVMFRCSHTFGWSYSVFQHKHSYIGVRVELTIKESISRFSFRYNPHEHYWNLSDDIYTCSVSYPYPLQISSVSFFYPFKVAVWSWSVFFYWDNKIKYVTLRYGKWIANQTRYWIVHVVTIIHFMGSSEPIYNFARLTIESYILAKCIVKSLHSTLLNGYAAHLVQTRWNVQLHQHSSEAVALVAVTKHLIGLCTFRMYLN